MKELSIEEKAKRYDEAIEVARKIKNNEPINVPDRTLIPVAIFPELEESGDERIGKELIGFIKHRIAMGSITPEEREHSNSWIAWLEKQSEQGNNEDEAILHRFSFYSYKDEPNILYLAGLYVNDEYRNKGIGTKILKIADEVAVSMKCSSILLKTEIGSNAERLYKNNGYSVFRREENQVWLEKQGEQKPADKVESKFKVGDWVVYNRNDHDCSREIIQVYHIRDGRYYFNDNIHFSWSTKECDEKSHLWTIQDAKDGDVLVTGNKNIFIFKSISGYTIYDYCGLYFEKFANSSGTVNDTAAKHLPTDYAPATKEQRDILFQKMHEAGYEWDSEKKELKKEEVYNLHNYLYGKQSPVWSKEDKDYYDAIITKLEVTQEDAALTDNQINFLKSLKDRVKPQNGYNPYKEVVESISELCKHYDKASHSGLRDFYDNVKVKCKDTKEYDSLFPQPTWKPSDEQMDTLEYYMHTLICNEHKEVLFGLYADLKKLREE